MNLEIDYPNMGKGIPFQEFLPVAATKSIAGIVVSGSGIELEFKATPTSIDIADIQRRDTNFCLRACVSPQRVASFCLITRDNILAPVNSGEIHPDFFAGKFVKLALGFFSLSGPVTAIESEWSPWSINFDQYLQGIKDLKDPVQAARNTWSGRIHTQNGFGILNPTEIVDQHTSDTDPIVKTVFRKLVA